MNSCEQYQAQLLEHLYGLLEADESLALIEHAGRCDTCRGALLRADSQRQLLAAAALTEFKEVRFQEPPVSVPMERKPRRMDRRPVRVPHNWRRWVAAAAILLALFGVGVPTASYFGAVRTADAEYEAASARVKDILTEERALDRQRTAGVEKAEARRDKDKEELDKIDVDYTKAVAALSDDLAKKKLYLMVTGHQSLRPGVANEYRIETRNLKNEPEAVHLDVRVRDVASGKEVMKKVNVHSDGVYNLELSPDAALKAGSQLALEVNARSEHGEQRGEIKENLTLAPSVYLTQLVTDKPLYEPGQTVRFRSLTLDRFTLKPPGEDFRLIYSLAVVRDGQEFPVALRDENNRAIPAPIDPTNGQKVPQMVRSPWVKVLKESEGGAPAAPGTGGGRGDADAKAAQLMRGIGAGAFLLPKELEVGEYVLQVQELDSKFPPERRKFLVNRYQAPVLNKKLKSFDQASYGPGDEVVAHFQVERAEGGLPVDRQQVFATIRVDGTYYNAQGQALPKFEDAIIKLFTNAEGEVSIAFKLPAKIERDDATLSVEFTDGSVHESLVKSIPVVASKLNLEFFPEGGSLVAGVPNRVYFQARTPMDRPAEVKGHIVDAKGKKIADVATFHDATPGMNQGMGLFTFEPQAAGAYRLVIDAPQGIKGEFALPAVVEDGVALAVPGGVTKDGESIKVELRGTRRDRDLLIGLYCRGVLLDHQAVKAPAGKQVDVQLKPSDKMGGVYRVTVFEQQPPNANEPLKPVAERLVYHLSGQRLNLEVDGKKQRAPGDKVTLTLKSRSERGQPLPTVVLVGVVDKSVVNMADERTARSLPTHFLLTSEVRRAEDLEYADVFLSENVNAPKALDLLLGTQGWRRFLESDPERFQQQRKKGANKIEDQRCQSDVQRLMVATGQFDQNAAGNLEITNLEQRLKELKLNFQPKVEELASKLDDADLAVAEAYDDPALAKREQEIRHKVEQAQQDTEAAATRRRELGERTEALQRGALLAFGVMLLVAGGASLAVGLVRQVRQALPVYAVALASVGLCGLLVLAAYLVGTPLPSSAVELAALPAPVADKPAEGGAGGPGGEAKPQTETAGTQHLPVPRLGDGTDFPAKRWRLPPTPPKIDEAVAATPRPNAPMKPEAKAPPGVADEPNQQPKQDRQNLVADGKEKEEKAKTAGYAFPVKPGSRGPEDKANLAKKASPERDAMGGMPMSMQPQGPQYKPSMRAEAKRAANNGYLLNHLRARQLEALDKDDVRKQLDEMIEQAHKAGPFAAAMPENKAQKEGEARRQMLLAASEPSVVREYAHRRGAKSKDSKDSDRMEDQRADFTETVYWHPALVMPNGDARIDFDLGDSVTTYQVLVCGHAGDGRLGSVLSEIESRKPFSVAATLPKQVVSSDLIEMPVSVRNDSPEAREVQLFVTLSGMRAAGGSESGMQRTVKLKPDERTRVLFQLQPTIRSGEAIVAVRATSEPFGSDRVAYVVQVVPEGFPTGGSRSEVLDKKAEQTVRLPKEWVKDTLQCELQLYPSRLADLTQGVEALLREPGGCFEQTSASNYPNVLVLDYLQRSNLRHPAVEDRAWDLLERGYGKLTAFECRVPGTQKRAGFEWFGGEAPPHEALTAYGLMQFSDMNKAGFVVDPDLLARTHKYLLSCRDNKGGFTRNAQTVDTFGRAPQLLTNAYIVWALTEADKDSPTPEKLSTELDALLKDAGSSNDPYFLALVANGLLNRGRTKDAAPLLQKLVAAQKPEGLVPGAKTSITSSAGRDLEVETTALAVLAWLKSKDQAKPAASGLRWIGQQRNGQGGFGATQATVLALKALTAEGTERKIEPGQITLKINGHIVGSVQVTEFTKETLTVRVPGAESVLRAGQDNKIEIVSTSKTPLPYTLAWSYQALKPEGAANVPVRLSTKLDRASALDGERVQLTVEVQNTTEERQGMVTAVVGLPSGLALTDDLEQLKNYAKPRNDGKEPGTISFWEIRDRELVLYWRTLGPKETVKLDLPLICRVPGTYRGAASRAYVYYNADQKHWIDPVQVAVQAK